jgi:hypothetical protein
VIRPGLIVGPHETSGRFTYWPHRIARGGEVLALGPARVGVNDVIVDRAINAALQFRPLEETVRGTLDEPETTEAPGLRPEREAALLAEWHGRE